MRTPCPAHSPVPCQRADNQHYVRLLCAPAGLPDALSRRSVLSAGCLIAMTAAVAGCAARDEAAAPAPGTVVGSTDDVPVGGGAVLAVHRLVVTQPVAGTFHAFSAVCTHQGFVNRFIRFLDPADELDRLNTRIARRQIE